MSRAKFDKFDWERAILRLDLRPPMRKLVALILATYADEDGTNIHPGEDRLAQECGMQPRAVRGHLKALRELGLIVRTFRGATGGRRQQADEYNLALPADIADRVPVLPMPDHRHHDAGDNERINGTATPIAEALSPAPPRRITGIPTSDHRHRDVKNTGTGVPPTNQ